MRVTKELLIKNAEEVVRSQADADSSLVAAYLTGSLLTESPLLGNTTDIDLVFVHAGLTEEREFLRLTEDIHLDIQHYPKNVFEPARNLRADPWLGTSIFNAKPIYDPDHFIDFIQASVRGMYHLPENILARVEPFLVAARQTWMNHHNSPGEMGPKQTVALLKALENIANGLSCLTTGPLSERRFLAQFQQMAGVLELPGLFAGILGLLGVNEVDKKEMSAWLPLWEKAYDKVTEQEKESPEGHPHRKAYYQKAIQAMLEDQQYYLAAWPLLNSWTKLIMELHTGDPRRAEWQQVFESLNLTGAGYSDRMAGLDAFLDRTEEYFDSWKEKQGL
ncbi:MAG: hypothetical protein HON98_05290 [Chloroflexi bacterium]|jgi:hypothetical protein|nr:hypothetical protein [Chloroflexota bacterium]MBT3670192.1 hypothetical protein [Chloroflexota bacterium]MBT4004062.1 hypothetical protein [Chloroflexota bacterium]MBT4306134.1 hypothetical protein [Chloroflexota bacterium]MBT4534514.1 hypothetical protein [Chloroflexota bacterium]